MATTNLQSGACIGTEGFNIPENSITQLTPPQEASYCIIQFIDDNNPTTPIVCVTEGVNPPSNDYAGHEGFILNNFAMYQCENKAAMDNLKITAMVGGSNKVKARILYYK